MARNPRIEVRIGETFSRQLKVADTVTFATITWIGPQTIVEPAVITNGVAKATILVGDITLGLYKAFWTVDDSILGKSSIEVGEVLVKRDLSEEPIGQDFRSHAEKTLEKVEAVLEGRATTDQLSYSLNGRSLSRIPISELREWRQHLRSEIVIERRRRGNASSRVRIRI